jgi:integrase
MVKHILSHKSGRRSYRRFFPEDLRPFVPGGKQEHKRSLGHEGDLGFLGRYEAADAEYQSIVATARKRLNGAFDPLHGPRIAELAELFRTQALEADNEARFSSEERELFLDTRTSLEAASIPSSTPWPDNAVRRWAEKKRETLEWVLNNCRDLRAIGDLEGITTFWRDEALLLCEAQGLVVDERAEGQMQRLCLALNDAAISGWEDMLRRLAGEDVPTPAAPVGGPERGPRLPKDDHPVPLLVLFDGYALAQGISPGVRDEWRKYIELLIKFLGHDDASRLSTEDLLRWRDELLTSTSRRGTIRDPSTVRDKYITAVRATLTYGVQERKLRGNVAAEVVVRVPKKAKLRDRDFTEAEAKAILTATLQAPSSQLSLSYVRARRWIPWLCAYTGARVNEFSQLRGEDVQQIDGTWVVRITPEAGRVKTNEARIIPLHEHLLAQGFVEMAQAQGPGALFYEPNRQRVEGDGNRHFKKVGEKLALWVRQEVGITDPGVKPNHAWRHYFKTLSYLVGIEERVVDVIQGHAAKSTGRTYGKPPLKALAEAIGKLPRFEVEGA